MVMMVCVHRGGQFDAGRVCDQVAADSVGDLAVSLALFLVPVGAGPGGRSRASEPRLVPLVIHASEDEHVQDEQRTADRNRDAQRRAIGSKAVFLATRRRTARAAHRRILGVVRRRRAAPAVRRQGAVSYGQKHKDSNHYINRNKNKKFYNIKNYHYLKTYFSLQ